MEYKQYKIIEAYFKKGEEIVNIEKKIGAIRRLKSGYLIINDLVILQEELSSFGLRENDCFEMNSFYDLLNDDLELHKEKRRELKDLGNGIKLDIEKILIEKRECEIEQKKSLL